MAWQVLQPSKGPGVMFIALGRRHGVCHLGSMVSKHLLPRLKSKDLFIGSTRRSIGARDHPAASKTNTSAQPPAPGSP